MEMRQGFIFSGGKTKSPFGVKQETLSKQEGRLLPQLVGTPGLTQRQDPIECDELFDIQERRHGLHSHLAQSGPQVAVLTWEEGNLDERMGNQAGLERQDQRTQMQLRRAIMEDTSGLVIFLT